MPYYRDESKDTRERKEDKAKPSKHFAFDADPIRNLLSGYNAPSMAMDNVGPSCIINFPGLAFFASRVQTTRNSMSPRFRTLFTLYMTTAQTFLCQIHMCYYFEA